MNFTIGVDVGTTMTKAVAFDGDGAILAEESRPTQVHRLPGNRYEQDTEQVVQSVQEVLAALTGALDGAVEAVGVTGQGDGLWLVDDEGRGVRPAISWLDGRAAPVVEEWERSGRLEEIYRRTGSLVFSGASGPILAWLAQHEPEHLRRAATAAYCKDVVVQRLTGARMTDPSDASVPWKVPHSGDYDRGLLETCGLAGLEHLLAPVHDVPRSTLTTAAAEVTGLPVGTPVVAAPYDLVASALGAGVVTPGDGLLIVGTTLACQVVVDSVDTTGAPGGLTLSTWSADRWIRAMPAMVGTAALDWALALTGQDVTTLGDHLLASPRGANGVRVLPFLAESGERAPFKDPRACGRIDGIRLGTSTSDVLRAFCEAIAFSARHCFEAAGLTGDVVACGGGSTSGPWRQIFADVLGRPLRTTPGHQVGARGAASAARRAVGLTDLPGLMGEEIQPDPEASAEYDELYHRYVRDVARARENWSEDRP